ncbi:MAG: hypothetical protein F6J93_38205 [Oscillatoria sp. SIO1A7]|nr:hypothetical protein [Oscillatoria sp. SIO1A7]
MSCIFKISSCKCPWHFREELYDREFSWGWAWSLPIKKIEGGIEVVPPVRTWQDYSEIDEGWYEYYDEHDGWQSGPCHSIRDCISTAWEEAGYAAAEPVKLHEQFCKTNYSFNEDNKDNEDLDEIPF